MQIFLPSVFIFTILSNSFDSLYALECKINTEDPSKVAYTITVSGSGDANFRGIQEAIDSIPEDNDRWIKIQIQPGKYQGPISIPYGKQCIALEGNSPDDTIISFGGDDSTFTASGDNFVAKGIRFENTYGHIAAAATVWADKASFYNCVFYGFHDTIFDATRRHYFKSCRIEGTVDFIWGNGQSVYDGCVLNAYGDGVIAAQGRESPDEPTGFVFSQCSVTGEGKVQLGRGYRPYSRMIYLNSNLGANVLPEGWAAWHGEGHEDQLTFAEANCTGPGSDTSKRVKWEKQLNAEEIQQYTTQNFIDQDGWISQQP